MKNFALGAISTVLMLCAGLAFANAANFGGSMWYDTATGAFGIGTSTPNANFQVTDMASNATSTVEIGKRNQNKGSCIKMYRYSGAAVYLTVNNNNGLVVSTTACKTGI